MFGIGWAELLVIICVIILFIRPDDLPKLLRRLGRIYSRLRKTYNQILEMKHDIISGLETEDTEKGWEEDEAFRPYSHQEPPSASEMNTDKKTDSPITPEDDC